MKFTFYLILFLLLTTASTAQTVFWSDDFEGTPTSGTRTPEENGGVGGPPMTSYFRLTDGSTVSQVVSFTGKQGVNYWAGEDHNAAGTGFTASGAQGAATNSPSNELQILWTGINIAGKTGLSFKGLIAANSTNEPWDNTVACASGVGTTNTDYIIVQYSIDAGPFVDLIRFYNRGSASGTGDKYLFEDANGDGCGDVGGIQLTNVFNEFTKTIPGTGATMSLKILVFSEGNNEEWAIDNFRLLEAPSCSNPIINSQPSNASVCNNGNTSFAIASAGATSWQWQVNTGSGFNNITNGGVYSNATTQTLNISGATTAMNGYLYRCIAMNTTCSTTSNQATLTVSNPSVTPLLQVSVSCNGGNSGQASVNPAGGGISPYSYNWTPGNPIGDGTTSVTGLIAGVWTCTVTDAIGCTTATFFNITQPPAITLNQLPAITNISCNGGNNGSLTGIIFTGGVGGFTYNWTPGNPSGDGTTSISGLIAGTWTCTVTDANNCTLATNFAVTQPSLILLNAAAQTNIACNGENTGAAVVNPASGGVGGYTYNWTPGNPIGDGTVSVSGLFAGVWTCTATDANNCTATRTFAITQPTPLVMTAATQSNITCNGGNNGAALVNSASGGAGGYTYNWTPGNPSGDGTTSVSGLTAGTWTCTVTDANNCTLATNFAVTQPSLIVLNAAAQTNIACNGENTGAAVVNPASGGVGGYTYNWTPGNPIGDGTISVSGLFTGVWTCTATDANNCTATRTFAITQPTPLVMTAATQSNITCNGGTNGTASVNPASGGAGGYTYNWTPGNPSGNGTTSISGLTAGTWTCTVTDFNNCTAVQTFTITEPPVVLAPTGSALQTFCNTATIADLVVIGSNIIWYDAPSGGTVLTLSTPVLDDSFYYASQTIGGCESQTRFVVGTAVTTSPIVDSITATPLCAGDTAILSAYVSGAGSYTYEWITEETVTLSPNKDNTIYSESSNSNGLGESIFAGKTNLSNLRRALLAFDVSSIPSTSTILSATLTMSVTQTNSGATIQSLHELTEDWGEGTTDAAANEGSGGAVTPNSATWTDAFAPGTPWAATGGSFNASASASTSVSSVGSYAWSSSNLANDVQNWVNNPSSNFGWILLGDESSIGSSTKRYGSVNNPTASLRPSLQVTHQTILGTAVSLSVTASGTYTVIVTDVNGCSTSSSITINSNTSPVVTASASDTALCLGDSVLFTGGGALTYAWIGSSGTPTDNVYYTPGLASSDTYTVTGTDANGCTNTASISVNTYNNPQFTLSTLVDPCPQSNLGSAVATLVGIDPATFSTLPVGPFIVADSLRGLIGGQPYIVVATNSAGCTFSSALTVGTTASGQLASAVSGNSASLAGNVCETLTQTDATTLSYYGSTCDDLIATLVDTAGGNVLGDVTVCVTVEPTVPDHNGQPYVRRWYNITPTNQGAANVTLYFTQDDFDTYNANNGAFPDLPTTSSNSDPAIPLIRITKVSGGALGIGTPTVITPLVNWNNVSNYWELTFTVDSFSGFFIHAANPGNIPLSITLERFVVDKINESAVLLSWTTASEVNNQFFDLMRSKDGVDFTSMAQIASKANGGNSQAALSYQYTDASPYLGNNFYRIDAIDIHGKRTSSTVREVYIGEEGSVSIYPNPANNTLFIDLTTAKAGTIDCLVRDVTGKIIYAMSSDVPKGKTALQLNLSDISSGLYTVEVSDNKSLHYKKQITKH